MLHNIFLMSFLLLQAILVRLLPLATLVPHLLDIPSNLLTVKVGL